jgi:circadian clock protein KaiC
VATDEVIRTGIAGFDKILLGGIPRGNVVLVQGATDTGKTLFGMEFIYRGITEFNAAPGLK